MKPRQRKNKTHCPFTMIQIVAAITEQAGLLARLGRQSFIESHGHSAPVADIEEYVASRYTPAVMEAELRNPANNYFLALAGDQPAGYSNLVFDAPHPDIPRQPAAKLDRIYLLQDFYGQGVGQSLFDHNRQLAQGRRQTGIWLYTWKENPRAIRFYTRQGFRVAGGCDFPISKTHSNPNHLLWLEF